MISNIISIVSALVGAAIGGYFAYKGSINSVDKQISYQVELLNKEERRKHNLSIKIISKLLWTEINYNCKEVERIRHILENDNFISKPTSRTYFELKLQFDTYNQIKYELIKYDSEVINDTIEFYRILYMLSSCNELNDLTQEEFNAAQKIYSKVDNIKKYIND